MCIRSVICNFKVCGQKESHTGFNTRLLSLLNKANPMFSMITKIQHLGSKFPVI